MNNPQIRKYADLRLEQNDKLGFYTVGDKIYHSKPQALIAATQTGHFPHWNFNNEIFGSQPWTEEPEVSLQELYRLRAQQLREQYDYVRIEISGGSDGNTALYSFLLNGIHVDEIVFRYPKTGEKHVNADPFNTKAENTLSEYKYAAQPLLHWIATNYPKVKITIHDYSLDMLAGNYDETWVFHSKDYFQPGHVFKHNAIGMIEHRRQAESGKKICVLYGIDKPKICIRDNQWYLYFLDIQANCAVGTIEEYNNITNEYFFWTPDMPEIVRKQAHIIRNWFSLPQNVQFQYLIRWPNHSFSQRTAYEQMIKPLIYPDYDHMTFQTAKPTNSFYNEMDHWFYTNFQGTEPYDIWQAGLNLLVDNIDPKFFNREQNRPVGFVGFLSPFYCIGDAVKTDKTKHYSVEIPDRF
jgi:hypothetical protein